jgi:hypothetical protein
MSEEEYKLLAEKIISGAASKDERLLFMKELNRIITSLREDVKKIKNKNN